MEKTRLWFIDNLRVLLTVLVVLHHVAVMYSGLPLWYYTEQPDSPVIGLVLTVFLMLNQAWFMGAFFLLSGYFTNLSHSTLQTLYPTLASYVSKYTAAANAAVAAGFLTPADASAAIANAQAGHGPLQQPLSTIP